MTDKSDVQTILDAVAGFTNSINGFRESITKEIKSSEHRVLTRLTEEINRTNLTISEVKADVEVLQKSQYEEKTLLRIQKVKLGVAISIAIFVLTPIIGIIQHFITKAFQ